MSSLMEKLLIVQNWDRRVFRLEKEAGDLPLRKQQIQEQLSSKIEATESAKSSIQKRTASTHELEVDVDSRQERISKLRGQQGEVKTNEEYRALENEVQTAEHEIAEIEERELSLMEETENENKVLRELKEDLSEDENKIQQDLDAIDERGKNIQEEIKQMKASRDVAAQDIDPTWLSRYERIINNRGDYALVAVERGFCGGCHMKLPPQEVQNSKKPDIMTSCSHCGRILYHP